MTGKVAEVLVLAKHFFRIRGLSELLGLVRAKGECKAWLIASAKKAQKT
jgi:hypothetical protein